MRTENGKKKNRNIINVIAWTERDRDLLGRLLDRAAESRRSATAEVLYELECFENMAMQKKGTENGMQ